MKKINLIWIFAIFILVSLSYVNAVLPDCTDNMSPGTECKCPTVQITCPGQSPVAAATMCGVSNICFIRIPCPALPGMPVAWASRSIAPNNMLTCTEVTDQSLCGSESCSAFLNPTGLCGYLGCEYQKGENSTNCPQDCYCGNGVCELDENNQTCFSDCPLPGWEKSTSGNSGFKLTKDHELNATNSSKAAYTTAMDLRAEINYTLTVKIKNPTSCNAYVDLDDGHCFDANGWLQNNTNNGCFDDNSVTLYSGKLNSSWQKLSKQIVLPSTKHNSSDGYYKQLHLRLVVDGCSETEARKGILFDDISLVETKYTTDRAFYDNATSGIDSTSGCCPKAWCWDGDKCVDSIYWMNDSQKAPIWNLLNIGLFTNEHVNTGVQAITFGYRCVLNSRGEADWTISRIKYDWDYKTSGYCPKETDCFVNKEFDNYGTSGTSGDDCIVDGQSVDADWNVGSGNHYCYKGYWTTKSYILATALENLTQGKDFVLFCDDANKVFNNNDYSGLIAAACNVVIKEGDTDKPIVGFALNDITQYPSFIGDLDAGLIGAYQATFGVEPATIAAAISDCTPVTQNHDFKKCADENNLKIYYNTNYSYFIMSKETIPEIDGNQLQIIWTRIADFFRRIFGLRPVYGTTYEYINYTSNFNKIYIMRNHTMSVQGIEEAKYDEYDCAIKNFLYLNFSGVDVSKNIINTKYLNQTYPNYVYANTSHSQEIVVKSAGPTNLFEYLTAMLRDR